MSRITLNTKCRLCRTAGSKLYLKGVRCNSSKCPIEKKGAVKPGMHGAKGGSKPTDYGIQLRAKQKAKRIYGVQETQFKNYYLKAKKLKGLVGDNLMILLEKRLDNVLYKSGLVLSRSLAKQLTSHKHVLINGKKLNISSYETKIGDLVSFDAKTINNYKDVLPAMESDFKAPQWLDLNKKNLTVKVISTPVREEIGQDIDVNLIIEYYSR
ncbi:MAG: 30S ribosomal protein S4 [Candidatus Shapirobacteria bacterium]|nr:30S ribosomal protein S4 [Candidatus Shapirobacteria bacterium]MDD4410684.1 30S ribosomal protein S4 [Candidatus Shapirobacteria bacterium]